MAGKRVLIVAEAGEVGRMLRAALESIGAGLLVRVVPSAEEALQDPMHGLTQLVVMDTRLPGISGFELVGKIRLSNPRVRAILLARQEEDTALNRARMGLEDRLLVKPVRTAVFLDAVRAVLEISRQSTSQDLSLRPSPPLVQPVAKPAPAQPAAKPEAAPPEPGQKETQDENEVLLARLDAALKKPASEAPSAPPESKQAAEKLPQAAEKPPQHSAQPAAAAPTKTPVETPVPAAEKPSSAPIVKEATVATSAAPAPVEKASQSQEEPPAQPASRPGKGVTGPLHFDDVPVMPPGVMELLNGLCQRLGAGAALILDMEGNTLAQAGSLPGWDGQAALFPEVLAAVTAAGRAAQQLQSGTPQGVLALYGTQVNLAAAPAAGKVLIMLTPADGNRLRAALAFEEVLLGSRALEELLAPSASLPQQPEDLGSLLSHSQPIMDDEQLAAFWEAALSEHPLPPGGADTLSYEQATRLNLAPEDDSEG